MCLFIVRASEQRLSWNFDNSAIQKYDHVLDQFEISAFSKMCLKTHLTGQQHFRTHFRACYFILHIENVNVNKMQ
jgi:hypothetical protein